MAAGVNNLLKDFDWDLRTCISSDKVSNLWSPLLRLSLNREYQQSTILELDSDGLQRIIEKMEIVEKAIFKEETEH